MLARIVIMDTLGPFNQNDRELFNQIFNSSKMHNKAGSFHANSPNGGCGPPSDFVQIWYADRSW